MDWRELFTTTKSKFELIQHADEIVPFYEWLEAEPQEWRTALEIGIAGGGNLIMLAHLCSVEVVGVDRWPKRSWPLAKAMNNGLRTPAKMRICYAYSDDAKLVRMLAKQYGEFDIVFVDADHSYEAVKTDFAMYWPLVAPDGIMAFHDIAKRDAGVPRLWGEVLKALPTKTFVVEGSGMGIGVAINGYG